MVSPEVADLPLDLGRVLVAEDALERVASNQGQPGIALGGLLARLHDYAGFFELHKSVTGVRLLDRNIDDEIREVRDD